MSDIEVVYLIKSRSIQLQFRDGSTKTFAPSAIIPEQFANDLLKKQVTIGGCCGKPQKTVHLFATQEQLNSGERKWIE